MPLLLRQTTVNTGRSTGPSSTLRGKAPGGATGSDTSAEKDARKTSYEKFKKDVKGLLGVTGSQPVGFTEEEARTFTATEVIDVVDTDGVKPEEVAQQIVDCYWVASLHAVLARDPHFLESRVEKIVDVSKHPELDPTKDWYAVKLFSVGTFLVEEETVFVSTELPGMRLKVTGAESLPTEAQMKALVYEKAFAQWLGGYDELKWGNAGRTLTNMTGNDAVYRFLANLSADAVWTKLERWTGEGRAIVAVAMNAAHVAENLSFLPKKLRKQLADYFGESRASTLGLVDKHCYSVVKLTEEPDAEGKLQRLVHFRNPRSPDKLMSLPVEDFKAGFLFMTAAEVDSPGA